jgi:hypothetical protein
MPVIDGIQATNAISHAYISKCMRTVILGLTGDAESQVYSACIEAGMSEVRMLIFDF